MPRIRPALFGVLAATVLLAVSGCTLGDLGQPPDPAHTAGGGDASAPDGWASFPPCPQGPNTSWVWVEGFPAAQLETATITPDCGDTWFRDDGKTFVDVTALHATEAQLGVLGIQLADAGYVIKVDTFVAAVPGDEAAAAGARDYYLDGITTGDFTRVAIEIYSAATDPMTYQAFIDFVSPRTRVLTP